MKLLICALALAALALPLAACAANQNGAPAAQQTPEAGVELEGGGVCTECSSDPYYVKITAEAAKMYIDSSDLTVVDVRTKEEYDAGHIEGAINLPLDDIGDAPPAGLPNLDDFILVYCRSGVRSKKAAEKLIALGYLKVYDFGGVNDWPYGLVSE